MSFKSWTNLKSLWSSIVSVRKFLDVVSYDLDILLLSFWKKFANMFLIKLISNIGKGEPKFYSEKMHRRYVKWVSKVLSCLLKVVVSYPRRVYCGREECVIKLYSRLDYKIHVSMEFWDKKAQCQCHRLAAVTSYKLLQLWNEFINFFLLLLIKKIKKIYFIE